MSLDCRSDEEDDAAPLQPGFSSISTPTKAIGNDGACHAGPDAERTEADSIPNAEKQFNESTSMLA